MSLFPVGVFAQANQLPGTYGNEFWLAYLNNANVPTEDNPKLYIYAVAEEQVDIIIALGTSGAQLGTINIPAGGGVGVSPALLPASVYPRTNEDDKTSYDRGIRIYATNKAKSFSCFALSEANVNTENSTRDATLLLPTDVLDNEYFVQSYPVDGVATQFVVVATEDGTEVTVTPTAITAGDHAAGAPFSMNLKRGQTLFVKSKELTQSSASMDLSGSTICATKPVAVFNGNVSTKIPHRNSGGYSANHTFEQLIPQPMWGKDFFVSLAAGTKRNYVQVTASVDGTQVTIQTPGAATRTETLDRGQSLAEPLLLYASSTAAKITATEPIVCYHYFSCGAVNQEDAGSDVYSWGNPTNALVVPWTHRVKEMSFYTSKIPDFNGEDAKQKYYVQLIINSADKNKIKLDGTTVASSLFTNFSVDGSKAYGCIPIPVPDPSTLNVKHRLETTGGGFVGYVYGMTSEARAYEYTLGFDPPSYPDSLFTTLRDDPTANIMSPYSYDLGIVENKGFYQRQLDEWPIGQERLDTAYVCNGTWLKFFGQLAPQNSSDSIEWKVYKCRPNGQRFDNPVATFHSEDGHYYTYQFTVDAQEDKPADQRDPFQLYAVDMERYKKHLICTDLAPECDTLRTMVKTLRAYNDTTWRVVCEIDTVHFFKHNDNFIGPGTLNEETIFRFNYTGSDPNTVSFHKGHNIWTRRYHTPNGCDSIVTLCIFGCDTSYQEVDTTVCESQLARVQGQSYSFTLRDKNGHNRTFYPITVKSQDQLRTEAASGTGIQPYAYDLVAWQLMKSCLNTDESMSQEDKDTIAMYNKYCSDFEGCDDSVKLHITIMPLLYTPEQNPAIKPWCTGGDPTAVYDEWTRADGQRVRTILQTDTAFNNPAHPNIGYFRDTTWHTACPTCTKCPKEITTLVLLKVDNTPQVSTIHICRDETYIHMQFMQEHQTLLKGWELWDRGYNETNYYEETHGVDVKDDQGEVGCQYMETLRLYIHNTYANTANFSNELTKKDTTCIAKDPQVDHYEWEEHTGEPGEIHYVWDVTRRQRVPANFIPTTEAGTFEFVDSLKTKTCTNCKNQVGCDSIWRLTLIVGPEIHDTIPYVLCRNSMVEYKWNDVPYYYYGHLYDGDKKTDPNAKEIDDAQYLNTACSGDKYFYETFSGVTRYRCDSTVTVKIHYDSTYVHTLDTFICEGTVYHFFDKAYTYTYDHTPGATNIHMLDSLVQTPTCGCDSGVTHYVHVRPVYSLVEAPDTTCQAEGAFYEWRDHPRPGDVARQIWMTDMLRGGKKAVMSNAIPLDVAGTFFLTDSLRTVTCPNCHGKNGCDSVVSITLVVIPTYDLPAINRPLSSESYFVWDDTLFMGSPTADPPAGVTYTYLERVPGTMEYTHHYFTTQTVDGKSVGTHECDSLFTYRIVVGEVFRDTTYAAVCENCEYLWHMEDPNTDATKDSLVTRVPAAKDTMWYHYNLKTALDFDSIYNLCLTGFPTKYNSESAQVCQGERFEWDGHSEEGKTSAFLYIVDEQGVVIEKIDTATFNSTISLRYGHYTVRDSLLTDTVFIDPRGIRQPIHCDSIWDLELEVTPTYNYQFNYDKVLFNEDLCSNETLLWNNHLFVGYDYDLQAHPIDPVSPTTPYSEIIYIPRDSVYSFYDSVPSLTGTKNYRCDSINYLQIAISKYDTTWVKEVLGDNDKTWYFGGKGGTFRYRDPMGNIKDRITVSDLVRDIPLPEGTVARDTFLIDTLRLTGCDSIIWDSIYIFKTYEFPFDTLICSNIPWSWRPESPNADKFRNMNYRGTGVYYDSLKTVHGGVDSVYILNLQVQPAARHTEGKDLCKNDTITWEYQTVYYRPEVLETEVHYSTGAQCDSVMVLRATWFDFYHFDPDTIAGDTICRYDDIVWITPGESTPHTAALRGEKGEIFDKIPTDTIMKDPRTGKDVGFWMTIYDSLHTVNCGCDSTYTLRYYVRPAYHFHEEATICSADTFRWRGMELFSPEAMQVDTADRYMMADGTCDSIYFLTLHINQTYDSIFYDTICANQAHFTWQGHNLDEWLAQHKNDTLPVDTFLWRDFQTTQDCDSLYKLYLTVWPIITDTVKDTICVGEKYMLVDRELTQSGIYYATLTNKFGCDSFVVLYLEVEPITKFKMEPLLVCADQGAYDMAFTFDREQGKAPREVRIVYDSLATANGFPSDTVVLPVTGNSIAMQLPDILPYVRPNHYGAKIYFDNGTCVDAEKLRVDFTFEVAYPSWILEQHWMDAVGILNEKYNFGDGEEGYIFSAYQWYKNGEELVGQTRPYLYMPHLLEAGAEYSVSLVREGEEVSVMSCPIVAEQRENATMPQLPYVSVVPTLVVRANPIVNILCYQKGGTYKLYNPFGSLIQSGRFEPGEHNAYEVKLPAQPGIYLFQLNQDEGEVRTVKVVVN